jgi:hypothetical protein
LLPHTGAQSLSTFALHIVAGQHPSLFVPQPIVPLSTHLAWHPEPCNERLVHPWFGHDVGQLPSQTSPASITPLPQKGEQSLSLVELHVPIPMPGQHESPFVHAVCMPLF